MQNTILKDKVSKRVVMGKNVDGYPVGRVLKHEKVEIKIEIDGELADSWTIPYFNDKEIQKLYTKIRKLVLGIRFDLK